MDVFLTFTHFTHYPRRLLWEYLMFIINQLSILRFLLFDIRTAFWIKNQYKTLIIINPMGL